MFLRLILEYLKKRKTLKQLAEIDEILKNHPVKVYEDENAGVRRRRPLKTLPTLR